MLFLHLYHETWIYIKLIDREFEIVTPQETRYILINSVIHDVILPEGYRLRQVCEDGWSVQRLKYEHTHPYINLYMINDFFPKLVMMDFNGISTFLGLIYTQKSGNYVCWASMITLLELMVCCLCFIAYQSL